MGLNLIDLASKTESANGDLLHINTGGANSDFKQLKSDFLYDVPQRTTFNTTSTLFSQIDALPKTGKKYYGIIGSYGHQSETGVPINASFYVDVYVNSSNSANVKITVIGMSGRSFYANKGSGSWGDWKPESGIYADIATITVGQSKTFTLENNSRILLDVFGGAPVRNAMYNVFCGSSGAVVWTAIHSIDAMSITSSGNNKLTVTNTLTTGTGLGLYINALAFMGSITPD